MSEIIDKTYKLLDTLESSDIIINLTKYKNRLMNNKSILNDIRDIKSEFNQDIIINKKKELYYNYDYKMYMKYYNELYLIILKINKKYQEYTNTRDYHCG